MKGFWVLSSLYEIIIIIVIAIVIVIIETKRIYSKLFILNYSMILLQYCTQWRSYMPGVSASLPNWS